MFKGFNIGKTWILFVCFALSIFVKCIFFHYSCCDKPLQETLFAKLFPALFFASFIFLFNKSRWTIVLSVLIDLWLVAELIYFRANDFFLDEETILLVSNMDGFWNSIFTYLHWKIIVFPIITIIYSVLCFLLPVERNVIGFAIVMILSLFSGVIDYFYGYSKDRSWANNAFKVARLSTNGETWSVQWVYNHWVMAQTPLHFFFAYPYHELCKHIYKQDNIKLSDQERQEVEKLLSTPETIETKENLILIIGESFESWAFEACDVSGEPIMKNCKKLMSKYNTLYADKVSPQIKAGTSGDGQMILTTGLLPISSGVACMLYGDNEYPSFAKLYPNSYLINPCKNVWNQTQVTKSYGYKTLIENERENWMTDEEVFTKATECFSKQPFCLTLITIATHGPFEQSTKSTLQFSDNVHPKYANYLKCMHYTDSCIGILLNRMEQDSLFKNTNIVITGDHTIFKSALLKEFRESAEKNNLPLPTDKSYCPLILYSPSLTEKKEITDVCYQMDIYPTILHCIGADKYYWKGFGINLMNDSVRTNRQSTDFTKSYLLSDKIIRGNFFLNEKGN